MRVTFAILFLVAICGCAANKFTLNTSQSAYFPVVADVVCTEAHQRIFIRQFSLSWGAVVHVRWTAKFRIVRVLKGDPSIDRFQLDDAEADFGMKSHWRFETSQVYQVGFHRINKNGAVKGLQVLIPRDYFDKSKRITTSNKHRTSKAGPAAHVGERASL